MTLFLEIMDGELKGTRTLVRAGISIGRREGTLTIRDSKLSNKHAQIELRSDGYFWLVDLGSSNGIKMSGGTRTKELKLEDGASFVLGRTPFRVIGVDAIAGVDDLEPALEHTMTRTWRDTVLELAAHSAKKFKYVKREVAPFVPMVRLRFIRGTQSGTEWLLGYGPRAIGSNTVELTLEDPSLPGLCFRLIPHSDGTVFKNESDAKLNGKWVEKEFLHSGDVIEIGNTQVQVEFDEQNEQ
jgi:predicted component of type VI protein secretion system